MTQNNTHSTEVTTGVVLITGASSGIGLAISKKLLQEGHTVIGLARDFKKCEFVHEHFQQVAIDLSDSAEIENRVPKLIKSLDQPLRALVNNAGIGKMGYLEQLSVSDIRESVDTNFLSHVLVTKAALPLMKQQTCTSDVVFLGSEAALSGAQQGSIYCATKFALRGFAQSLRQECAKSSVRITLVNPGAVRSNFFDNLNFEPGDSPDNAIEPDDVAKVVSDVINMRAGTVVDEINLSPLKKVWQSKNS